MQRQMDMDNEINAITEMIKETVVCEKIYLFGSYAYGNPNVNSDLDYYVVIPDDADRPIEVMHKIRANLYNVTRAAPIDIIAARSSRFTEMCALPTMERQIAREGILLYEYKKPD